MKNELISIKNFSSIVKGFSFDVDDPSYVCIWTGSKIEFDLFRICGRN